MMYLNDVSTKVVANFTRTSLRQITLINISYSQPQINYLIMVTKELHSLLLSINLNSLTKWVLISLKKSIIFTLILKIWGTIYPSLKFITHLKQLLI